MVCKYKFVLMYNEYNLYFNSFTKKYPRWIEWSSQQISSFELIRDLLFFKSSNVKARRLKFFGALEG